ncbi:hypothetical protein M406DRAFT_355486 [Cryphonectria parasitica EP155]|uniref:Uncharacterized protein n=1 Tax=Cryphonectria parasitica (strain ATCC 38755 / EP155) TaxID=660469 RepID=A0A9P5CR48_CRYP1|nr:uncharacterized protein M406DRAFT_355486 [Cryphonectria parasitica EP155]KAF3767162.1 hypothetical protein M406DRAFT_355486 [Cryphonectria parasitica EP155]
MEVVMSANGECVLVRFFVRCPIIMSQNRCHLMLTAASVFGTDNFVLPHIAMR